MRAPFQSFLWSVGTVVVAAVVAFLVAKNIQPSGGAGHSHADGSKHEAHHHGGHERDFHAWLHENLKITAEQEALLLPHEKAFEEREVVLLERIREAGSRLAKVIRDFDSGAPEVVAAQQDLLTAQGELQQVTLEHFFAMKEFLDPEQGEKLLEWTHDSLIHGYAD